MSQISHEQIAHWREWIGRSERRVETLEVETLRRFAMAIGEDVDVEQCWPSLGHWAFFLPAAPTNTLDADGHPQRGGFLPPVTLPRRMFAAGGFEFLHPLRLGLAAEQISTIRDVTFKSGRSGELVIVEVERRIGQEGVDCLRETQTIVYRGDAGRTAPVDPVGQPAPKVEDRVWRPTEVDLFRFSAATFNSHRIHYDLPYATNVEGYPGLVVHGPLTACRLYGHCRRVSGASPSRWSFRAAAPLFCGRPILITAADGAVKAIREDGVDAMIAGPIAADAR